MLSVTGPTDILGYSQILPYDMLQVPSNKGKPECHMEGFCLKQTCKSQYPDWMHTKARGGKYIMLYTVQKFIPLRKSDIYIYIF